MTHPKSTLAATALIFFAPLVAAAGEYDPSPAHPWGRPNPEAPAEIAQFAWAIGSWSCDAKAIRRDGSVVEWITEWAWRYTLNGMAIEDKTSGNNRRYQIIRQYDANAGHWINSLFGMNGGAERYLLNGVYRDGEMILESDDVTLPDGAKRHWKFMFHSITDSGYTWSGYYMNDGEFINFQNNVCARIG